MLSRFRLLGPSRVNLAFAGTQGFFWAANCVLFGFLVAYLNVIGFSYVLIGLLTTLMAGIGVLVQPLAGYITDTFISPRRLLTGAILLSIPCTLLFPLVGTHSVAISVAVLLLTTLETALGGVIDSWCVKLRERYQTINYSATRSMGSMFYGAAAFLMGFVIARFGYEAMFTAHIALMLVALFFILQIDDIPCSNRAEAVESAEEPAQEGKIGFASAVKLLVRNYPYMIFIASAIFYNVGVRVTGTFLPTLITLKGGDSSDVGIALGIAAFFEFPVLIAYMHIARKVRVRMIYVISMLAGLTRILCFLFISNVHVLEACQVMQSLSFGLYIPFCIEYVNSIVPRKINATSITIAQAVANGLGSVVGNLFGGVVMQRLGMPTFLLVNAICVVIGLLVFVPSLFSKPPKFRFFDAE